VEVKGKPSNTNAKPGAKPSPAATTGKSPQRGVSNSVSGPPASKLPVKTSLTRGSLERLGGPRQSPDLHDRPLSRKSSTSSNSSLPMRLKSPQIGITNKMPPPSSSSSSHSSNLNGPNTNSPSRKLTLSTSQSTASTSSHTGTTTNHVSRGLDDSSRSDGGGGGGGGGGGTIGNGSVGDDELSSVLSPLSDDLVSTRTNSLKKE